MKPPIRTETSVTVGPDATITRGQAADGQYYIAFDSSDLGHDLILWFSDRTAWWQRLEELCALEVEDGRIVPMATRPRLVAVDDDGPGAA